MELATKNILTFHKEIQSQSYLKVYFQKSKKVLVPDIRNGLCGLPVLLLKQDLFLGLEYQEEATGIYTETDLMMK